MPENFLYYAHDSLRIGSIRAPFGKRNILYYNGFPNSQRWYLLFLSALQLKIKGRDSGTINGHNESLSIRILMKGAREALVR